jgi:hypothetical protein
MAPYGKTQTSPASKVDEPARFFRVTLGLSFEMESPIERALYTELGRWMDVVGPLRVKPVILSALLRACAEDEPGFKALVGKWAHIPGEEVGHG